MSPFDLKFLSPSHPNRLTWAMLRAVCAALVSVGDVSLADAADCNVDSPSEYTNSGGSACSIPSTTTADRVTASGAGGVITANGVRVSVPHGVAVMAQGGASVLFGVDPQSGGSSIYAKYPGSGGITGLLATGGGSQITASGLSVTFSGGGLIGAQADTGGTITLNQGVSFNISNGGRNKTLYATGTGSQIIADGITLTQQDTGGDDISAYSTNGASISMANSTVTVNAQGGGVNVLQADAGGRLRIDDTNVTLTGGGDDSVGIKAATGGEVSMTGGTLSVTAGNGSAAVRAQNSGTTVALDNTDVTINAGQSAGLNVQNGADVSVTGGSIAANGTGTVGVLVNGGNSGTNAVSLTDTAMTSTSTSFSVNNANAGIDVSGSNIARNGGVLLSTQVSGNTTFNATDSVLKGAITTDSSSTSNVNLEDGTRWTVTGNSNMTRLVNSGSTIDVAAPTGNPILASSYTTLTTRNYVGASGTLILNTYLGSDNSPSDQLVVNAGVATGSTKLQIQNTTGQGQETVANGIEVIQTTNGATTSTGAFTLAGEVRAGALDYALFRGGVNGTNPQDWFLRSTFVAPEPETPGITTPPPIQPGGADTGGDPGEGSGGGTGGTDGSGEGAGSGGGTGGSGSNTTEPELPVDPPTTGPLEPGATYPIIGPELATYGAVQPTARQLGLAMLGTMHERIGDTLTSSQSPAVAPGGPSSAWARVFGQQIDNRYRDFADTRTSGQLLGVQAGVDLWHGSLANGQRDTAGVYFAYGNGNVNVDGLVTSTLENAYVLTRTGKLNLNGYSLAGYWTHYGSTGWYLDAVLQGTYYDGNASTEYADLPLTGSGFISSLEAGYPIPLPLGPRFVLEPQLQLIWQRTSFSEKNDGLGPVDPGSTTGTTGRVGVRGQWTIERADGAVWQPYGRINLWHDWGGRATTLFANDPVPLEETASRLEFSAGLSARISARSSLYAQLGYQFAIGGTDGGRRQGVIGDLGYRYRW